MCVCVNKNEWNIRSKTLKKLRRFLWFAVKLVMGIMKLALYNAIMNVNWEFMYGNQFDFSVAIEL